MSIASCIAPRFISFLIATLLMGYFQLAADDFIYWTERSANPPATGFPSWIKRAKLDGSGMETIFQNAGSDQTVVVGLALDVAHGYLYTGNSEWLFRLNLDGTGQVNLVPAIDQVRNISLDLIHGKIYWVEGAHGHNAIRCANLNGSNPQTLIDVGFAGLFTIALDPSSKLYFFYNVNSGSDTIQSMNLDGSGITTIYDLGGPDFDSDDLDIDLGRSKLYKTGVGAFGGDGIFQASLDGSTPYSLLFATPDGANSGICYDRIDDKLYYFNGNATTIEVADINGGNRTVLVQGIAVGERLKVGHGIATPCPTALSFDGFLAPVGGADATGGSFSSPVRTFKLNSTIPLKFAIACSGSPITTGVHTLQVIKWSDETTSEPALDATPTDAATTGNQFRLVDSQWHFNLDTKVTGMSVGKWQTLATLSDGSEHSAWIQIK
jgi:hypothetical protein